MVVSFISIIIPTYNRADMISEAIKSVLNQTYQNFEIIVVDDGSTDGTKKVIENINDSRIIYIYKENEGPSAARNTGIKQAKGEYIAFLDSDDFWLPEKLEKQINFIENNTKVGIVSCCSGYGNTPDKPTVTKICTAKNNTDFIKGALIQPDSVITGTPTMLVKKECFDKVGYFNTAMKCFEDWDMWLRIVLEYDFYCIDEMLVFLKTAGNSLSSTIAIEELQKSYICYLDNAFNNANLPKNLKYLTNRAYSNAYWIVGWLALYRSKNRLIAKQNFWKSLKANPRRLFKINFLLALILSQMPSGVLKNYLIIKNKIRKK